ncbi:MAG: DUF4175 family protein [Bacteroidota bacterium]
MQTQHEQQLDQQLRGFREKYYKDKIIRGFLISGFLILFILFVVLLSEGIFGFSSQVRTGLVYGMGALVLFTLGYMVLWPASKLFKLSQAISDFQIAGMVQKHFPEVNDKLINLLQLRTSADNSLALAAIDRKAEDILPVSISRAINLDLNRKYLYLLGIPLVLFLLTYLINPNLIKTSGAHLINYDQQFTPPAPFSITINDLPENIIAGQDLELNVSVEGNTLPAELYLYTKKDLESQFMDFQMQKKSTTEFSFLLSDLKEDISLYVGNPEVSSEVYELEVLKRPYIKNFQVLIRYPDYTNLGVEKLEDNIGDFKVLKGSQITWKLKPSSEVAEAFFVADKSRAFKRAESDQRFSYSTRLMKDLAYFISLQSPESISNIDTVRYRAEVIADRFPSVYVLGPNKDFLVDLDPNLPLDLEIADDYGFTKMNLFYRFVKSGGASNVDKEFKAYPLEIDRGTLLQPLTYTIDLTSLGLKEGDEIEYFLKVWDNDGVSGPKASTSATYKVIYPTLDAKYDEVGKQQEEVKEELDQMKKKADELKEAYKKMQQKLLDKKQLNFDDRKEIQNMIDEHQDMLNQLEETQEKFEETKEELQENEMISEETLKKFEELNEFLEELRNPEVEKLLEELQEKMEDLNPEDIREQLEKLEMNDEEIQKSLERTLELFKQLEVQEKIDELRNKVDNLAAKQETLNEQTENAKSEEELDQMKERQEELNKQMEGIKEDMKELEEMKEDTNTPDEEQMKELQEDAEKTKEEMKDASEQMENASEQMQNNKKKQSRQSKSGASQSQKNAKQKLQEMSDKLSSMQMQMQMQQDQQNLEDLRELLENLLTLSFDQEDLRDEVKTLKYGDPALKSKSQQQKKLQDDMELVSDSLDALANRVFQIQKFVMDKSRDITTNMDNSQNFFRNKQVPMVTYHQQLAMTGINDLANMLAEVMKQMQEQMKNAQKKGNAMCNKPNGNKPSDMKGMGQQQKKLNQQMQQMMNSGKMDAQKLAEMAARQAKIRQQLQGAQEKMGKNGKKMLGDMDKVMQDMRETETELLNKTLTHETLKRQQKILTRMLYADKSIRERDLDDKRESKTGRVENRKSPEELSREEYRNKIRQELLKSNQLEYSSDFIQLIEQYYKKLEETHEPRN